MSIESVKFDKLVSCSVCHYLEKLGTSRCRRCHSKLHKRQPDSIQETMAYLIVAMILYIPANVYPIMVTSVFGKAEESTIIGGVVQFIEMGSYFVAGVIFTASIIIPVAKIAALIWLCYSATRKEEFNPQEQTIVYRLTEFIGKWSMIDVFVVSISAALIQLEGLMTIKSGIAANAFSGVVIATMISAHKFDIRLIWDKVRVK